MKASPLLGERGGEERKREGEGERGGERGGERDIIHVHVHVVPYHPEKKHSEVHVLTPVKLRLK